MARQDTASLVAAMLNAAWQVRNSRRRPQRRAAIQKLGLAVREAFNKSSDFEVLLDALMSGLNNRDDQSL